MNDHAYDDYDHGYAAGYRRIHANSEETHVVVIERGDDYTAIAIDIDPREYSAVASEVISFDPTLESAVQRAGRWMQQHPKGIAGGESDGGGGAWQAIMGMLRKLNEYGNQQTEQMQDGDTQ